jgi:hypothetical protein
VIDWEYQEGATWSWPADYADFRWGSEVGFDTPEEAAAPEIPPRYVCIVSVAYHPDGDHAVVELLTNEEPRLYPYTVFCIRDSSGRWHEGADTTSLRGAFPNTRPSDSHSWCAPPPTVNFGSEMLGAIITCCRTPSGAIRCHASLNPVEGTASGHAGPEFSSVADAIAWARSQAQIVLIYADRDDPYSAGDVHERTASTGEHLRWREWPPLDDDWPDRVPGCGTPHRGGFGGHS